MGYDRWASKHNLKQMAATVTAYQQYGFSSPEELDEACSAAYAAMQESLTELKQVEKTLNGKKELQRQVLAYSKTRPVRDLSLIHIYIKQCLKAVLFNAPSTIDSYYTALVNHDLYGGE